MTPQPPTRILLVEDDEDSAEALLLLLGLMDCEGQWVRNGTEALHAFASARKRRAPYPDLVLMDLNLPGMNGVALSRELLRDAGMCPIVFVSAAPRLMLQEAATEAGAFAVLRKPFGEEDLRGLLQALQKSLQSSA